MLQPFQNTILEMIAKDRPLAETANRLCLEAERLAPEALCTLLLVDADSRVRPLASPSLPASFSDAFDGVSIGPDVGSCGTAAFTRSPVAVTDISHDPRWAPYAALAEPLGLKACWSSPIVGRNDLVLATFAFYYRVSRGPSETEKAIVAACIDLCVIAMERDQARCETNRLAYFDTLTGLPNRSSFNRDLASVAGSCSRLGLLMADIDHLKHVNDTFGHSAGDDLIREVGVRIGAHAAPGTAYRLSGDEFAVIIAEAAYPEQIADIAGQILDSMQSPMMCAGATIAPRISLGSAFSGAHDRVDAESLCREADLALYEAKEHHRGGFVPFTAKLGNDFDRRARSNRDLSDALSGGCVEAFYQPVVKLDTREVVGLEALCRIRKADNEVVSAEAFLDAIHDATNSIRLTDSMVSQVVSDLRSWLDLGIPVQHVGVNVTMADFRQGDLLARLHAALARHDVPIKHLIVEVTEAVYLGHLDRSAALAIEGLRSAGLRVALDDFGTGFASLTHLLTVPVDVIKIDKSFVSRLEPGDAGEVIVAGLIDIADKLGIRIVAEGVETVRQARQLSKLGCRLAQGYIFAPALDRQATTELLLRSAQQPLGSARGVSAAVAA